jgi:hypothetical protein
MSKKITIELPDDVYKKVKVKNATIETTMQEVGLKGFKDYIKDEVSEGEKVNESLPKTRPLKNFESPSWTKMAKVKYNLKEEELEKLCQKQAKEDAECGVVPDYTNDLWAGKYD